MQQLWVTASHLNIIISLYKTGSSLFGCIRQVMYIIVIVNKCVCQAYHIIIDLVKPSTRGVIIKPHIVLKSSIKAFT